MKSILKILWSLIKRDDYIFYSKNSHTLLYNIPDKDVTDTLQKVESEAALLYYQKHII